MIDTINKVLEKAGQEIQNPEAKEINPGLNVFKIKNPVNGEDIEISVNVKI
ncbi:MAG: hypothetical protein LBF15_05425 [Candidatus Peribacteria bacterium]|nr:hypothetical protein [Candidatus Peribacteria bacterium]